MYNYLEKNRFTLIYFPLALYWIVLFTATTLPGSQVPNVGFGDKSSHFFGYLVLGFLLNLTLIFQRKSRRLSESPFFFTILICTLYSIIDETHQILIPGRYFELFDLGADLAGTLTGVLLVKVFLKMPEKERTFRQKA